MTDISYSKVAKKKRLLPLCVIAALIVSGFLFWFFQDTPAQITSTKANTLAISGPWEISSLDPSKQGYILTRMQVTETLLNVNAKGEITSGLATDWQVSNDGLDWVFTLRKDVQFHDGTLMDANSVKNSLDYALKKHGSLKKAKVERIDVEGDDRIRLILSEPYASLAALLTNYSTAILSPSSYDTDGTVKTLYGTGPYRMDRFYPPHKMTVKAFADYWGQPAKITYATYLTGHRAESRLLQAKSGEADIVFTLDPSMLSQLKGNDNVTLHSNLIPRTLLVKLNSGHPYLSDVRARQALSFALNRRDIATNVLNSAGSETAQLLPASMSKWYLDDVPTDEFNLSKAKSLLTELGWKPDEKGILVRDGQPFELTLITYADRPELTTVATAIQAQWAKLGVKINVDVTNSSMIPAGHHDGSLQMALIARNFGINADPLPIISTDFSNGGDWGTMNWHNADVDAAISSLIKATDHDNTIELSQQVARALYEDYPILPIASYSQHTAVNHRVKHFQFDPYERNYFINLMEIKE